LSLAAKPLWALVRFFDIGSNIPYAMSLGPISSEPSISKTGPGNQGAAQGFTGMGK
jgi:hypothetical protein